ncbi:hypothetical protein BUALT_Bualt01G0018800 [Buddleja alternifolia]|uniref:Uncharacterized protein n=1 Tax=Buddleja alternifolia TaxID=168488 RepID=A0AAV6Y3S7_9LAMI|nr:hypothetical protein BUALT_Bualt01G0018800 [Buddleja alternifolia]
MLVEEARADAELPSYDAELAKLEINRCVKALSKSKNDDIAAQNKGLRLITILKKSQREAQYLDDKGHFSETREGRRACLKSRSYPHYSSEFEFENRANPYTFNGPSTKDQAFGTSNDPEMKRKKRIATYNMFATEGKVKASVKESFKWIKTKFSL